MEAVPLERPTPARRLAEELRERLLSGLVAPGTALGDETLTAAGLPGAPATPRVVREALAELAREELVVHSLQRGVEVVRPRVRDVRDAYATRRVLEHAGLDALLAGPGPDVAWLQAALTHMELAASEGDRRAAVEADTAFHLAIVAAAGSPRLLAAARGALRELRLVLAVAERLADDLPSLVADHAALVAVIAVGRPEDAHRALTSHLDRAEAEVLRVLLPEGAAPGPDASGSAS